EQQRHATGNTQEERIEAWNTHGVPDQTIHAQHLTGREIAIERADLSAHGTNQCFRIACAAHRQRETAPGLLRVRQVHLGFGWPTQTALPRIPDDANHRDPGTEQYAEPLPQRITFRPELT